MVSLIFNPELRFPMLTSFCFYAQMVFPFTFLLCAADQGYYSPILVLIDDFITVTNKKINNSASYRAKNRFLILFSVFC